MKKYSLSLTVVFLAIFVLLFTSGCSQAKVNKNKVVIWIMPNSQQPVADLENVLRPFKAKNPGLTIEIVPLDWGSAWQKITAAAAAGEGPDICQLGSTWVGAIAGMDALEDVSPRLADLGGPQTFVPAAWKTSGLAGHNEKVAIPWIVDVRGMYYRTDVFQKLGLTVADLKTWSSFEKTLEKIKRADLTINGKKVAPLAITGKNDWNVIHNLAPWIWAAGGDFISKDLTKSTLNQPEAVKGVSFYVDLVRKGYVPQTCLEQNTAQINNAFFNGHYAIYFNGPYDLKTLQTPPERGGNSNLPVANNFGVAPYPAGPAGVYTYCGGSNLAILKSSKNKDLAWQVVKYLTTDTAAQVAYSQLTGFLPAKMDAFKDPYFSNDPFRKVFRDSVAYGRVYPCIPAWGAIETVVLPRRFGIMWDKVTKDTAGFTSAKVKEQLDLAAEEINNTPAMKEHR